MSFFENPRDSFDSLFDDSDDDDSDDNETEGNETVSLFNHWSYNESREAYIGGQKTETKALKAGVYNLSSSPWGEPVLFKRKLREDELFTFETGPAREVLDEINSFWNTAARYKQLGVTHKRGILLHGPHGCGKTGIIQLVIQDAIKRDGIVFEGIRPDTVSAMFPLFRQIEPDRPVTIVGEDLDQNMHYYEEKFLELLDGTTSVGGFLFVATTNNFDGLPSRIRDRPSRIDTLVEVGPPAEPQRIEYLNFLLKKLFPGEDIRDKISLWAQKSEGFSLAQLKELVISIVVHQKPLEKTIERLAQLNSADGEEEKEDSNE